MIIFYLTLPNPTDVNAEKVKYSAVIYFERRFGPPKHIFVSKFVSLEFIINEQLYGLRDIRANSSSHVIRDPKIII